MKVSLVITVLNEEQNIIRFLKSVSSQKRKVDELIIVDGGSRDKTTSLIQTYKRDEDLKITLVDKRGNRSVGRNEGIRKAGGDVIALSDAGCILDDYWIQNLALPFKDPKVEVVAGYYKGSPKGVFQKSLIPYVLVMPDKLDAEKFLPATRSMAVRKSAFERIGGFDPQYSHNEDYVFAQKLVENRIKIYFARDAIVSWIPRKNFKEAFIMFARFAYGDAEAGILRTKVLLLFTRYFVGLYFIFLILLYGFIPLLIFLLSTVIYIAWATLKNYKYVRHKLAFIILPLLQLTADFAVLSGSLFGGTKLLLRWSLSDYARKNTFFLFSILIYILISLFFLRWGIPNADHPFPYFMDEWHQLQAVRATFALGTPNVTGAANGTMLHFMISGIYLIPFTILSIINPFLIKIDDFAARSNIFEILRLNTVIFGVLSTILLYNIARLIRASSTLTLFLFVSSPIWITLSDYFKYDIALVFWILLSIYFQIKFIKVPNLANFLISAIPAGLAVATKVSAIPLLPIYIVSFFLFMDNKEKKFKYLLAGVVIFLLSAVFFGTPDTLFGRGNIYDYFYNNVITTPGESSSFILGSNVYYYLFLVQYPLIFGWGLFPLFLISATLVTVKLFKGFRPTLASYKVVLFLLFSLFVFLISILPLAILANGNRSLVLLPYAVLIVGFVWTRIISVSKFKTIGLILVAAIIALQVYQVFAWLYLKGVPSPQEAASDWIVNNINNGSVIGLENIPIYQFVPDIIQREFYFNQYGIKGNYRYKYEIIDSQTKDLPKVIVISNGEIESQVSNDSPKKKLLSRIKEDGYQNIVTFKPDFRYLKYFASEKDFYFSALLVASPVTISVFAR